MLRFAWLIKGAILEEARADTHTSTHNKTIA